jgi:hypothetical protein
VKCIINATHRAASVALRSAMHARNTHSKPRSNETRRNAATHGTIGEGFLTQTQPQSRWNNQVSSIHCPAKH